MISTISSQPLEVQNKYASLEKTGSGVEEKPIKDSADPKNSNNDVIISDAGRKALEASKGGQPLAITNSLCRLMTDLQLPILH